MNLVLKRMNGTWELNDNLFNAWKMIAVILVLHFPVQCMQCPVNLLAHTLISFPLALLPFRKSINMIPHFGQSWSSPGIFLSLRKGGSPF